VSRSEYAGRFLDTQRLIGGIFCCGTNGVVMGVMIRLVCCVGKGNVSVDRLCLTIVKLPLGVDMEPSTRLIVFVALDVTRLSLPLVSFPLGR
jgi:hypothetical protein